MSESFFEVEALMEKMKQLQECREEEEASQEEMASRFEMEKRESMIVCSSGEGSRNVLSRVSLTSPASSFREFQCIFKIRPKGVSFRRAAAEASSLQEFGRKAAERGRTVHSSSASRSALAHSPSSLFVKCYYWK